MPSIAIVGASPDRQKFGNKAVRAYLDRGWTVYPVHPREKEVEGVETFPSLETLPEKPDMVTSYVPPKIGLAMVRSMGQLFPDVPLHLNPGSESEELLSAAKAAGIEVTQGCAILNVGAQPSDY